MQQRHGISSCWAAGVGIATATKRAVFVIQTFMKATNGGGDIFWY